MTVCYCGTLYDPSPAYVMETHCSKPSGMGAMSPDSQESLERQHEHVLPSKTKSKPRLPGIPHFQLLEELPGQFS